jgi:hypothetical protein
MLFYENVGSTRMLRTEHLEKKDTVKASFQGGVS